jgi:hypothetical protein
VWRFGRLRGFLTSASGRPGPTTRIDNPRGTKKRLCAFCAPRIRPFLDNQSMIPRALLPIVLLAMSNVFMTIAWYGHLKFTDRPLWLVVIVSWGIAFFEYCLAVPANRYGSAVYSPAELKTMQECITLIVFTIFSAVYLGEQLTLNHTVGFAFIALGAFFVFKAPL